ncbi:hypothetical protein [Picrophilus oshimae]|uniref:Aspartate kinase n=1 Tax=Picrophilus torridus (strain ATCC 700027 / DSM 9790 / JCM 10055 / NBRC 100828 / KAW 2/3) TaxID=1122961 RepID=Q6L0W2_PICTO|nr:hypothetical protein [Picrophilus oshimae]AAT43390.1 hypothetical protein PTO0805 [Picrophilus oshimae DSM 9789]SMD30302.1 hypothetical protein SAMN02745355_0175 [Picrophilus oshimae DSM 9789]
MTKISDAVKVIVENNLVYSLSISSGMCNYTKLAQAIKSKVETMTGKDVKVNTIVKVLAGMKENAKSYDQSLDIFKKSSMTIEYKYNKVYCNNIREIPENSILVMKESNYYTCIANVNDEKSDFALIKILLPKESAFTPGLTLLITDYLMTYDIKFTNIYRLDTEIWIMIDNTNAGKALYHLSSLFYS